jgi:hypothetical protein
MISRKKPPYGDPCNRCGLCCMTDPCRAAQAVLLVRHGACPALKSDGLGGFFCGLLSELQTPAERDAARFIIGAGIWCDMLKTPEDTAIRNERLPALEEMIGEQRQALTPAARAVVDAWIARLESLYSE